MRNRFITNDSGKHAVHRLWETPAEPSWLGAARRDVVQSMRSAGQFIGEHPVLCLGAALLVGIIAGWRIKRT